MSGAANATASTHAHDQDVTFSAGFLTGGTVARVGGYLDAGTLSPGVYPLAVHVNGTYLKTVDVQVHVGDGPGAPLLACVPATVVQTLPLREPIAEDAECIDLAASLPGARVRVDASALKLLVSVPQALLATQAAIEIARADLDRGIAAGFVDYTASSFRGRHGASSWLGLNAGVNIGAWRLRHKGSLTRDRQGLQYQRISSQLQRELPQFRAQLLVGQGSTGGELFPGNAFTGVQLASDERMLPITLRGYAPVIRGMAEGNARVRVTQGGTVLRELNVAPGAFLIDDLYPNQGSGDLDVTVTEADGRQQRFQVGFAATPQALRPGQSRSRLTVGELRHYGGRPLLAHGADMASRRFIEATHARGLSNILTSLIGVQVAGHYQSALLGAALNTGIGALGLDFSHARARLAAGHVLTGNKLRLNYRQILPLTGAHLDVALQQRSGSDYMELAEAAWPRQKAGTRLQRERRRLQVGLGQSMPGGGQLSVSAYRTWQQGNCSEPGQFQLSYQHLWGRLSYGLSVARQQRLSSLDADIRIAMTLSVALGVHSNGPRLGTQWVHDRSGLRRRMDVGGSFTPVQSGSYRLAANDGPEGAGQSAHVQWRGSALQMNGGISRTPSGSSQSLGLVGSLVAHAGGVNAGPSLGEGFALVHAPGGEGALVGRSNVTRIAANGYAVQPYLTPYQWNRIELDTAALGIDVEVPQGVRRVAPTAGSVILVPFDVRRQRTLFIDVEDVDGQPLPYGAGLYDATGRRAAAVGQGSVVQLRGALPEGQLVLLRDGKQDCQISYHLPDRADIHGLYWTQATCQPIHKNPTDPASPPDGLTVGQERPDQSPPPASKTLTPFHQPEGSMQ